MSKRDFKPDSIQERETKKQKEKKKMNENQKPYLTTEEDLKEEGRER